MDINSLMAQATELKLRINSAQKNLEKVVVKGLSDNGDVIIEMSGKYKILNLTINERLLSQDKHSIEQIIIDAFNDAKDKADKVIDEMMESATTGIQMPE
ncbi:MAG: YbaB/EbfC family nucleoid-associated protein [Proteobacteria bacterium]|nr:YbaB/EbfC family nucleoid-associated protein [Candidatus Enterousia scatequi]